MSAEEVSALKKRVSELEGTIVRLEARIRQLGGGPPEKTPEGICYITGKENHGGPDDCPHRSIYRYQKQCRGGPCVAYGREYYNEFDRQRKKRGTK